MKSEWELRKLADLATEITVGFVGSMSKEYVDQGIPFLRSLNVNRFQITDNDLKYISVDFHKKIAKSALTPGDVVIVRTGKPGTCAVIPDHLQTANCSDLVIVRCGDEISNKFLCYYINSEAQTHISAHLVGAVQQHFNVGSAKEIEIALPRIQEQKAIAHVLGTIDDKIELNQKMNKTLEEIAKAIFKSWFVDFDPVRAKAEGRPTGLPPEISDLFPDELVDSEIGEIPKGWEVSPLSKFIMEVGKKTKPSPETEDRPYVPIDCISSKSLTLWESKNGEEAKSSLVSFKKGDILFGAMRPYFHKVCIAPFDGTTRTTCLVLSSNERDYFGFSVLTLFLDSTIDFATQNSTGSTIPYIKWKNELETLTVSLPPAELAGQFNKLLEPILAKFIISNQEQKVLSELRDTLLPKLISGELRIPDAEKFLEEAGI